MNLGAGAGGCGAGVSDGVGAGRLCAVCRRKICGVIEAKAEGTTLSGFFRSGRALLRTCRAICSFARRPGRFEYVASSSEILFRDLADPQSASRRVFAFSPPGSAGIVAARAADAEGANCSTCRRWFEDGLRDCQVDAVTNLEHSLAQNHPARWCRWRQAPARPSRPQRSAIASGACRLQAYSISRRPRQSGAADARRISGLPAAGHRAVLLRNLQCAEARQRRHRWMHRLSCPPSSVSIRC